MNQDNEQFDKNKEHEKQKQAENSLEKTQGDTSNMSPLMEAIVKANKEKKRHREQSEIPKFDLAEEIMAEHRKVTSKRRRSPQEITDAQKQTAKPETARHAIRHFETIPLEQIQIIREIVARDIERLCGEPA